MDILRGLGDHPVWCQNWVNKCEHIKFIQTYMNPIVKHAKINFFFNMRRDWKIFIFNLSPILLLFWGLKYCTPSSQQLEHSDSTLRGWQHFTRGADPQFLVRYWCLLWTPSTCTSQSVYRSNQPPLLGPTAWMNTHEHLLSPPESRVRMLQLLTGGCTVFETPK